LPGQWETNAAVASSVANLVRYDLPDDYYKTYDARVRNLTVDDVRKVSGEVVRPSEINWFMVGDRAKIAEKLDELGFEQIIEIDADGKPISKVLEQKEVEIKN